jgi:RNA-directed DNA polymerase
MKIEIGLRRPDTEIVARFRSLGTRRDVADLLEIEDGYLRRILYLRREQDAYRTFTIRKKRGGTRVIAAPPNALSILQSKLNHVFQLTYKRKRAAHGFVRGSSILSNAALHVGKRWVLNVDLVDFFPSINFGRVRGMLMAPPYAIGDAAATVIAQICCADGVLPQGAPSSPMLANMVCGRLDGDLTALAKKHHAAYSRYADDITISARTYTFPEALAIAPTGWVGPNVSVGSALQHVIETNGFSVNPDKSRLQLSHCRQEVTGICVNVFPNVNRSLVREVRAMLHAWRQYGLEEAERDFRERFAKPDRRPDTGQPSFRRALKGKLDFIEMVRGRTDPISVKLRTQLHELEPTLVPPPLEPLPRTGGVLRGVGTDPGWTRWFRALGQGIFQLETQTDAGTRSGTAFAYRQGVLATAAHNLVGEIRLSVPPFPVVVKNWLSHNAYDAQGIDCAIARYEHGAPPLLSTTQLPMPGEPIAVIGFASVPRRHPSLGIYPGVVESINTDYYGTRLIQLSVKPAGGLSGSPVINAMGQVVGIMTESTFEQTQEGVPNREFCFALPIARVAEIAVQLRASSTRRTARSQGQHSQPGAPEANLPGHSRRREVQGLPRT